MDLRRTRGGWSSLQCRTETLAGAGSVRIRQKSNERCPFLLILHPRLRKSLPHPRIPPTLAVIPVRIAHKAAALAFRPRSAAPSHASFGSGRPRDHEVLTGEALAGAVVGVAGGAEPCARGARGEA